MDIKHIQNIPPNIEELRQACQTALVASVRASKSTSTFIALGIGATAALAMPTAPLWAVGLGAIALEKSISAINNYQEVAAEGGGNTDEVKIAAIDFGIELAGAAMGLGMSKFFGWGMGTAARFMIGPMGYQTGQFAGSILGFHFVQSVERGLFEHSATSNFLETSSDYFFDSDAIARSAFTVALSGMMMGATQSVLANTAFNIARKKIIGWTLGNTLGTLGTFGVEMGLDKMGLWHSNRMAQLRSFSDVQSALVEDLACNFRTSALIDGMTKYHVTHPDTFKKAALLGTFLALKTGEIGIESHEPTSQASSAELSLLLGLELGRKLKKGRAHPLALQQKEEMARAKATILQHEGIIFGNYLLGDRIRNAIDQWIDHPLGAYIVSSIFFDVAIKQDRHLDFAARCGEKHVKTLLINRELKDKFTEIEEQIQNRDIFQLYGFKVSKADRQTGGGRNLAAHLFRTVSMFNRTFQKEINLVEEQYDGSLVFWVPSPMVLSILFQETYPDISPAFYFQMGSGEMTSKFIRDSRAERIFSIGVPWKHTWIDELEKNVPPWFFMIHDFYHSNDLMRCGIACIETAAALGNVFENLPTESAKRPFLPIILSYLGEFETANYTDPHTLFTRIWDNVYVHLIAAPQLERIHTERSLTDPFYGFGLALSGKSDPIKSLMSRYHETELNKDDHSMLGTNETIGRAHDALMRKFNLDQAQPAELKRYRRFIRDVLSACRAQRDESPRLLPFIAFLEAEEANVERQRRKTASE